MKYLILLSFLISACDSATEKEKPETRKEFELKYRCEINDNEILAVEIEKVTYYPDEDKSHYRMQNFQRKDFKDGIVITDTVYVGCRREVIYRVIKKWGDIHGTNNNYWKFYLFKQDTIESEADSILQFNYPEDTLKAHKFKKQFDKEWTIL